MSSDGSINHTRFLYTVADLYYSEGKTQAEIAHLLGVSRSKVLRGLQEAREVGIVLISVIDPTEVNDSLAAQLEEALNLRKAIVVAGHPTDSGFTRQRVGHAAAAYLEEILPENVNLGLGWGRTLYSVAQALEPTRRRKASIVPLVGGLGKIAPSFQVHDMARVVSEKLGGSWSTFYVPALVDSPQAFESLMASRDVTRVTAAWRALDVALIGIGNVDLGHDVQMLFAEYLDENARGSLYEAGAVGDICMRFFDVRGVPVDGALSYLFSIGLEQLAAVDRKIAVACGSTKAAAIIGAARSSYIDTLVTDSGAASEVLRLLGAGPTGRS